MYKIEDLANKNISIYCGGEEWKANVLLDYFDKNGITWFDGENAFEFTGWKECKDVCFGLMHKGSITFASLSDERAYGENKIINFEDVIGGEY